MDFLRQRDIDKETKRKSVAAADVDVLRHRDIDKETKKTKR